MTKTASFINLAAISLQREDDQPLYHQLYHNIRQAILAGRLTGGTRLPSTRSLAKRLDVSRNTVVNAFDKLMAEGYLEGKVGAGTYITSCLPEELLQVNPTELQPVATPTDAPSDRTVLSHRGQRIAQASLEPTYIYRQPRPFRPGLPALDQFPFKLWEKLLTKRWRTEPRLLLSYGEAAGYPPLREAIADYLRAARGVNCEAEQVIVVAGAQQAIDLTVRLLLDPGEAVWCEDPGYSGVRGVLAAANINIIPVPVDNEGLDVEAGIAQADQARMVYITPSHQFPLGVTMSLARRLKLLQWATQASAWVLEDDYDSEYRYIGYPLAALQGLDTTNRVIYVGTFSKVMFPALRLGYVVVPPDLVEPFTTALTLNTRGAPVVTQAVLADFMTEGHFARHIRRMRTLYADRQAQLIEVLNEQLPGLLEIKSTESGLHIFGWLPAGVNDGKISRRLVEHGIIAPAYSDYTLTPPAVGGLALGYAALDEAQIRAGVSKMAEVFRLCGVG